MYSHTIVAALSYHAYAPKTATDRPQRTYEKTACDALLELAALENELDECKAKLATARAEALKEAEPRLEKWLHGYACPIKASEYASLKSALYGEEGPEFADHDRYVYNDAKPIAKQEGT